MSSTFVADSTDDRKSDDTLIIIVNADGTLSVDPDALNKLLGKYNVIFAFNCSLDQMQFNYGKVLLINFQYKNYEKIELLENTLKNLPEYSGTVKKYFSKLPASVLVCIREYY